MLQCIDVAVMKPKTLVYYTQFTNKKYNEKSKENLKQNVEQSLLLKKIKSKKEINDVNAYTETYKTVYKQETKKDYRETFSRAVANKVHKITSVFVQSVIKSYRTENGFKGRIISFSTFTITEKQRHTDKVIIKTFIDFLDHLKKVVNYIICPQKRIQLKETAPSLKNYVWRAETQDNGNIHFHLIADCFLNKNMLKRLWNNYLGKLGYEPAINSCRVESLKKDKRNNKILDVENYLCKYMTKQPLKKEYEKCSPSQIESLKENGINPYRRAIIGKVWGCSRPLLKLDYPKFYNQELAEIEELRKKLILVKTENLPDFVKLYKGKTKQKLKECSFRLQRKVKFYYQNVFEFINNYKEKVLDFVQYMKIRAFERENKIMFTGDEDELVIVYEQLRECQFNYNIYEKRYIHNQLL